MITVTLNFVNPAISFHFYVALLVVDPAVTIVKKSLSASISAVIVNDTSVFFAQKFSYVVFVTKFYVNHAICHHRVKSLSVTVFAVAMKKDVSIVEEFQYVHALKYVVIIVRFLINVLLVTNRLAQIVMIPLNLTSVHIVMNRFVVPVYILTNYLVLIESL